MIDREDLENVFQQSPDHHTDNGIRPGNIADGLFYIADGLNLIGDVLSGIRDEMKKRNDIYEEEVSKNSSWMEK
mgnify:CR=1 FL=1